MYKRIMAMQMENIHWLSLRIKYRINYNKILLVLTNDNTILDYYALVYLKNLVDRKCAKEVIIFCDNEHTRLMIDRFQFDFPVNIVVYPSEKMKRLYDYYSFDKFFDNIIFTYTRIPKDNLLWKVLAETAVDEQDAVCLGLYHLRTVPEVQEKYISRENV